ncbi:MAG: adenylate/guanylate cyclase domain-containing protein [Rhodospirillales bacterium]|nr:adenylate/guanylate cyclase domain-containing protein [Rhodospirillales bacterium]
MNSADVLLLVVDDNEDNRYTLTQRLRRQGYNNVETAENGRRAIDMIESRAYDLILLDIMMPEIDGYGVLEHLKSDMRLRHVPVVMISSIDEVDSVVKCIELGAEDYLPKPFNPVLLKARIGACLEKKRLRDQESQYHEQIGVEKKRSDDLLGAILPHAAASELKTTGGVMPRRFDNVAVLFSDLVGFTAYCDKHPPEEVVAQLQTLVEEFEGIVADHGMEKIKTVGDAFMATAGLLVPSDSPVLACVRCGLDMARAARRLNPDWDVSVGVHCGPVVAGIVGHRQFLFDIWGDTVNVAARMSDHGKAGTITMPHTCWLQVKDQCHGKPLGLVDIKGKGPVELVECHGLNED